jgi:mannose/fructose/N-acetylgalactosamine-specific phosphotransferase system component IIC
VFAGLINQAKSAASGLVLKYVARASVAVPFIIALGFALAAITVMLVERFGHVTGYWLVAGGLAAIGIVAAITVSVKEHEEEVAEQQAEQSDNEAVSDATAQAMMQVPLALLGAVFTMPGGATSALKVARILGRKYPLVLLLVLVGALFWPTENKAEEPVVGAEQKPNGFQPAETLH